MGWEIETQCAYCGKAVLWTQEREERRLQRDGVLGTRPTCAGNSCSEFLVQMLRGERGYPASHYEGGEFCVILSCHEFRAYRGWCPRHHPSADWPIDKETRRILRERVMA